MELIPRYELQLACRTTGHNLVSEVLNAGPNISDHRIDEIFEPLIDSVESRARDAVQMELDELYGQIEDKKEQDLRDDLIASRRANIKDKSIIYVDSEPLYESNVQILWPPHRYGVSVDDISDSELMLYDSDDSHWDDYRDQYYLDFEDKTNERDAQHLNQIFKYISSYDEELIIPYMKQNDISTKQLMFYINKLVEMNVDTHRIKIIIDMIKYFESQSQSQSQSQRHRQCQMIIRRGIRKGAVCGRSTHLSGKCRYHLIKS